MTSPRIETRVKSLLWAIYFQFLKFNYLYPYVWVVLEARERARILGAGVMGVGSCLTWMLGTEGGSSAKAHVLISRALQPPLGSEEELCDLLGSILSVSPRAQLPRCVSTATGSLLTSNLGNRRPPLLSWLKGNRQPHWQVLHPP